MRRIFFGILFITFSCATLQGQTAQWGQSQQMQGFGKAVDVSGESVFVGEPSNLHQSGLVYVYSRTDTGWAQQTYLKADDGRVGDGFGTAISADQNRILIGAPGQANERGAAYIFERKGQDGWKQSAKIAISDTTVQGLGKSVALNNDLAFIGVPDEKRGIGAVYVYHKSSNGTWNQKDRLANPDTSRGFGFGSALTVNENKLVVSAPAEKSGAVYVYSSKTDGMWQKDTVLVNDQVDKDARYGAALSVKGKHVLVGAPGQTAGTGAVFVFKHNAKNKTWSAEGQLLPFDGGPRYDFGSSMAFLENSIMVGSPGAGDGDGAIYHFEWDKQSETWSSVKKIEGPDREESPNFAGRLAVEGDIAVTGMAGADYGAGKAAILERDSQSNDWKVRTTIIGSGTSVLQPITGNKVECKNSSAAQFDCKNVDLLSFLPNDALGADRGIGVNDIWGWKDPKTGKEYVLVGRMDGMSFVDVTDPTNPVYVGELPLTEGARVNTWRDVKVYKNHAYIVADNAGEHGMQIFDLTNLRDFDGDPITFEQTGLYTKIHSAHNVVINKKSGYAYIVGSSGGGKTCGGGLHMVNIKDPQNPTFAGCFSDPSTGRSGKGYTHDAQCVIYHGPDKQYKGSEICIGANETAISIADVTNKDKPKAISTASYPDHAYVHQGWLTEDHRYFYQNDELDEIAGNVDRTRTLVWDVSDLDDPQLVKQYYFDNASSDHNLYIKGNRAYESNYTSGLQILDVSDPVNPKKVGSFDTQPYTKDEPGFGGTWSNYPFFDDNVVIMTSRNEGIFILRPTPKKESL